ncbi:MAG TPA: hypothetical protein VEX63_06165 [Flavisolibacter sp.]|nr:hypothetical protein [Flavisolibacter sp.]
MKFLFTMLTVASSLFAVATPTAMPADIHPSVERSFKHTFAQATEVNWSVSDNFYKADFVLNGQYASVFYDCDGTLMATTRNISSLQLPVTLQAGLRKDYSEYWISNLFEMTNAEGINYYVTLQKGDTKITLKSASHTEWTAFQKTSKL